MAQKKVNVIIGAKNKMAAGLRSAFKSFSKFNRKVKAGLRSMGITGKRAFLAMGAGMVGLIKYGNQFRASMAQVNTMLGDSSTALPELTKQVRDLSAEFGLAKKTLADGLYQALSAGIPANNAIEFLTVAAKAAVGGVTDVQTSVDGLTTVMNAYGLSADRAADVSDILFKVVKEGKINYEELSENIGKVAPTAKIAGVELRQLAAMTATLVKIEKPERAFTALRQSMFFAAQEGKTLVQVLNEFEGKSLEDLLKAGVNKKEAAGIALMAGNMGILRKEMALFQDTAGASEAAFKKIQAVKHWQRLWQSILLVTSQVGEMIDTKLSPAISTVAEAIRSFGKSEAFDIFIEKVKNVTKDLAVFMDILSGGGDLAKTALSNFSGVILAAFGVASERMASVFKKAAPGIGRAIWLGFKGMAKAVGSGHGIKSAAKESVRRQMGVEMGTTAESAMTVLISRGRKDEFNRRVDEMTAKMIELNAAAKDREISTKGLTAAEANLKNKLDIFKKSLVVIPKLVFEKPSTSSNKSKIGGASITGAGAPTISASTSMLGASELFTMMQTGQARQTELSELQKQTSIQEQMLEAIKGEGIE